MELRDIAREIRKKIIVSVHRAKSPHVGSALSCVDLLTVLYFKKLRLEPWEERDVFILSKGHAAISLYATLAQKGIIDQSVLDGYYLDNGTLPAHLDRFSAKGVEVSAGSLGHGFNIGLGMAFAFKKQNSSRRVYTVIGDGESQEGSIWEGALFASKLNIDNFTAIVDFNNLQGYGRAKEICYFEPLRKKWESFGWSVFEVAGHDYLQIEDALNADNCGRPKVILACTTKGKGVSFMEDQLIWHYYLVSDEIKERAMKELE
jgi:transketolase